MSGLLQNIAIDIAESTAGVAVVKALNLEDKLNFGNSLISRNLSNGGVYFLVSDAINGATSAGSKLMNMNFTGALDDVLYFSITSMGAEITGADSDVNAFVQNTLSVSSDTADTVTQASIISASRIFGDYVLNNPSLPSYLRVIRQPVTSLMARTSN